MKISVRFSIRLLALAFFVLSISLGLLKKSEWALAMSGCLGLVYLTEIETDWYRQLKMRDARKFLSERFPVSLTGKLASIAGLLLFILYFVVGCGARY